jgi:hypothetical protein
MERDLQNQLMSLGITMFNGIKNYWSPEDMKAIYDMSNLLTGQQAQDTGCPSCRREKINFVRDQYMQLKRELDADLKLGPC